MTIGWQLILRRRDDAVLAPTAADQRALAACVGRVLPGRGLICFGTAGGHGHWPGLWSRAEAGAAARALLVGLGRSLGHAGQLEPARLRPIKDQRHLRNLFRYALDQRAHHGLESDPFHDATALPDLLGLRVTGAWLRPWVAERLPTVRRSMLVELLGAEPDDLHAADLGCLADAAAAAVAEPALVGRKPLVVQARAAAVQLARPDFRSPAVADALELPLRTVQRLVHVELRPDVRRAVAGQWRLRSWARQS